MAFDVLDAIKSGSHVVIEAGVGIGKSFAYLVPILLYNAKTFSPVVIATSTIALQEQLLSDVERLKKWLRIEPDLILAKGRTTIFVSNARVSISSLLTVVLRPKS